MNLFYDRNGITSAGALVSVLVLSTVTIVGIFLLRTDEPQGRHRSGLNISECISWCEGAGVETWERSHEYVSSSVGSTNTYCECVD